MTAMAPRVVSVLVALAAGAACTGKASVVPGDDAGTDGASVLDSGPTPDGCAPAVVSPRANCASCIKQKCPEPAQACIADRADCACGSFDGHNGELACLLDCLSSDTLNPMLADDCTVSCGVENFGKLDPNTAAVIECILPQMPMGMPVCPSCFQHPPMPEGGAGDSGG